MKLQGNLKNCSRLQIKHMKYKKKFKNRNLRGNQFQKMVKSL